MMIVLRFFAIARDRVGAGELTLELSSGATVADARDALIRGHASLAELMPRVAFAVNRAYAPLTTELHEGDELAVIPPVSGG